MIDLNHTPNLPEVMWSIKSNNLFPNNTPGEEKSNTFLLYPPGCYLFLAGRFSDVNERSGDALVLLEIND